MKYVNKKVLALFLCTFLSLSASAQLTTFVGDAAKRAKVEKLMKDYHAACGLDADSVPVVYRYPQYGEPGVCAYDFTIKNKLDTLSPMDYQTIVQELERMGFCSLDTSYSRSAKTIDGRVRENVQVVTISATRR